MRTPILIFILVSILLNSCDKGLSPDMAEPKVGFNGKITFSGEWSNQVKETHIIMFKSPLLSVTDFNVFNLKYVSENIPTGTNEYQYSTNDISLLSAIESGNYSYLAVAQTKSDTLSLDRKDWIVSGIYYSNNSSLQPGILTIPEASFVDNINIHCDFDNPPPQPPGGIIDGAFGGKITFNGEWISDVLNTHIILFQNSLLSANDFNMLNLKFMSQNIPNGTKIFEYSTNDSSLISNIKVGEYSYLAVFQSKIDAITFNIENWKVVGIYHTENESTKPGKIRIPGAVFEATFVDSINILVDFNNPPPQPPGGIELLNRLKAFLQNN